MKLENLGLTLNQLSGTIPPFIGNFTNLVQLSITLCGMQGEIPESLVQLKSLRYLFLNGNNLTGSIPTGLFNISTMLYFHVASNRLEGTIPFDIGSTLSDLIYLNLWGNHFTGEIPASLSNISSLEDVRLQINKFKGRVNIDFSRLSDLIRLSLADNSLEGDLNFITSLINCTQLKLISISSNRMSGSLPHSIANLSSLSALGISSNQLYGRIPPGIGDLSSLTSLYLYNNNLDGPIPSEIGKLNKLQVLHLYGNKFMGAIPPSLGNLTSLVYLRLDQNNLSGKIPQSLGNCTNLLVFTISNNSLKGQIPPQIMIHFSNSYYFNLSHNALTGSIPSEVGSLINLGFLDLSHNMLSGHVPNSLSHCVKLEEIYFQGNSFDGEIPNGLRSVRGLQHIDLSRNNISGTIPSFLGEFDLLYLNLSYNSLQGRVPSKGVFLNESGISLEGNSDLCGGIPSLNFTPCAFENSKKHKNLPLIFKVLIPVISVGSIALACYCMFICMKRKSKHAQMSDTISLEEGGYLRLSYADLQKATDGFSELNLLGAGKFGSVYKGILHDDQTPVAVKVLHLNVKGASKSFMSECNVLRSKRHRNLLKILSVCSSIDFQENDFKALVYEFMANGDLDSWLHRSENGTETLSLRQRLDIAIDIASALEYLHVGTDSTVVHGDLKPTNILLDEEMTAHVGDFGVAKIVSEIFSTNESSTSVGIRGTIGYIPPEYGMSCVVSTQGDVYSYGILLLEIFTGRRPTDEEFEDSCGLPDLIRSALPSQVMEVLEPIIVQEYDNRMNLELMDCLVSILEVGLACSMKLPRDRMNMTEVVNQLRKASQTLPQ